jgi:GT2 family glycosyltransferase
MHAMETIYILLPVHNRRKVTQCFIDCLKAQTFQNCHLILIDDGSTDGTAEMVQQEIESLTVIRGNGNWWWAGSLQQGYLWLKSQKINLSDLILIVNDDSEFSHNFIETGFNLLANQKKTLLASECYSQQTHKLIDAGVNLDWQHNKIEITLQQDQISCFSTKGLFLRWEDFLEIGGFYPHLLPHHAADYEFTTRAFRKGMKPMIDARLKLWSNELTTGYYGLQSEHGWVSLRKLFSKKSAQNPITLTIFVALSCPWQWKVKNWISIWKSTVGQIFRFLFQPNLYLRNKS